MAPATQQEKMRTRGESGSVHMEALTVGFCCHERAYGRECRAHTPRRLPFLGVVLRNAEADFLADFEAAIVRAKQELRRFVWVLIG
jgi:hypothetical protein